MRPFPGRLSVSTFGGLNITRPDGEVAHLQTQRSRALFVLLLLNRNHMVHRELLCAALWPGLGESAARAQLRKALWRIRSALDPVSSDPSRPVLRIAEHQVGLDGTLLEADCWKFADVMASVEFKADGDLHRADAEALVAAVELNRDTFAAGIFDDWCVAEQADLQEARIVAMERIVAYHRAQEHWLWTIQWAQRALRLDPIREHLHKVVMVAWYAMGDRASALRYYTQCERILREELGVDPCEELVDLHRKIAQGSCNVSPRVCPPESRVSFGARAGGRRM